MKKYAPSYKLINDDSYGPDKWWLEYTAKAAEIIGDHCKRDFGWIGKPCGYSRDFLEGIPEEHRDDVARQLETLT